MMLNDVEFRLVPLARRVIHNLSRYYPLGIVQYHPSVAEYTRGMTAIEKHEACGVTLIFFPFLLTSDFYNMYIILNWNHKA